MEGWNVMTREYLDLASYFIHLQIEAVAVEVYRKHLKSLFIIAVINCNVKNSLKKSGKHTFNMGY